MLELNNISLSYGKKNILNGASLSADYGSCIGLIGANGAGKSTLLSIISGVLAPDSGKIALDGTDITGRRDTLKSATGYVTQDNTLITELSAMDNLRLWTPLKKSEITDRLSTAPLSYLGVCEFINRPVKKLSGGMKKRLSLASVLLNNPKILLLDEPFAALDIPARHDILEYISFFKKSGGLVICASHEEAIFNFCDRVYLLSGGVIKDTATLPAGLSYLDMLRNDDNE